MGEKRTSCVERLPPPRLAGLVSCVWIRRIHDVPYAHRDVPCGSVEISCVAGGAPRITGPLTSPRTQTLAPGTVVAGARLRPGAAPALGIPAAELTDTVLDAELLWGGGPAAGPDPMAAVLELITARLPAVPAVDPLITGALRGIKPDISERHFLRVFRNAVGVAPKAFARIQRFQGFLARVQYGLARGGPPAAGPGLATLAAESGYADQSHLGRECLRLTGCTPRSFLRQTGEQCGHGHEHAASFRPYLGMSDLF